MKIVMALMLVTTSAVAGAAQEGSLSSLAWMAGRWAGASGTTEMEEIWMPPAGGVMVGMHRDVFASGRHFFEHLRIVAGDSGVIYLASPGGRQPPTPFRLTEQGERSARFENPAHDFPQTIVYRREGDVLRVSAEGTEGGKPVRASWEWRWAPFSGSGRP